ncbi:hypothetical protein CLOSCI_01394 [[Clostridium] scindens ATCC 35704]|nr:hypothetical protein CLOSCI_01394 [[Clostridium] scindens ATCC 35704]
MWQGRQYSRLCFFVLPGIESRLLSADLTAMQEMKLKLAKTDITLTKNEEAKEE